MIKSWKELPIGKYREISELDADEDWQWKVLAILNDTTLEDIITRPINETMALSRDLNKWIYDAPIIHPVQKTYNLDGRKFNFKGFPNDICTAQYIDFYNADKEIPKNIADVMAIFMVPEGHKYNDGYDFDEVKEWLLNHFSTEDALSVCDFFLVLFQRLQARLLKKAKRALKQAKKQGIEVEKTEIAIQMLQEYQRTNGLK